MDHDKSSAPPAEKSGPGAPPPYQDFGQYPGFQQPGPYPAQPGPGQPLMPGQAYPPYPQGYAPPSGPQYGAGPYGQPVQQYPPAPGTQGTCVTVQPTVYVTRAPLANPVNDYLGYSIFTMLCCCLPIGIAALVYSISTRDANQTGNQAAAVSNSRTAAILNHVALGIGLTLNIIVIVMFFLMGSF